MAGSIIFFSACGLIIIIINLLTSYSLYKCWIKQGGLVKIFPEWENTNKIKKWYGVWVFLIWCDLIVFTVTSLIFFTKIPWICICCFLIVFAYFILIGLVYIIVKYQVLNHK